uniref:Nudix hydrolase domain-containing protein n=1 Tax=Picea sitchensis TaxID=3332 RepID=B8LRG8_PICSI|nr:unknown [Picea sitchensis]
MAEELTARTGRHQQRYDNEYRLVAGCIPYRYKESGEACNGTVNRELEVLMVLSRGGTALIFPKGGWENDESLQEAACRETFEEAGVRGIIKKDLGCWDFRSKRYQDDSNLEGFHRAHMFALLVTEQLDSWPEQNERQRKWVTITEADGRCKDDWMRQALRSCVTYLSSRQMENVASYI